MAATVTIDETNGTAPGSVTAGITTTYMSSTRDEPSITSLSDTDAIAAASNSLEKWQRYHVSANADGHTIQNLKFYIYSGSIPSYCYVKTSASLTYWSIAAYATPTTTTSTYALNDIPTSAPATTNVPIGATLTPTSDGEGKITTTGFSKYIVTQIQTTASATAGPTTPLSIAYQYDEIG